VRGAVEWIFPRAKYYNNAVQSGRERCDSISEAFPVNRDSAVLRAVKVGSSVGTDTKSNTLYARGTHCRNTVCPQIRVSRCSSIRFFFFFVLFIVLFSFTTWITARRQLLRANTPRFSTAKDFGRSKYTITLCTLPRRHIVHVFRATKRYLYRVRYDVRVRAFKRNTQVLNAP
jgi:hypothetical protein